MYDDLAVELAALHHGVTSRRELRGRGASAADLYGLSTSRHWSAVTDEVFVRTGSPATAAQRLTVAVLDAGGDAVASHLTAARWWGLTGCPLTPHHVTTTAASRRRPPTSVRHRVRLLPAAWRTELDGVPVVRPELLALQLFATCREERAEVLVDRLWSHRLLSGPSVHRFLEELGRRGRNGTAGLRRYLDARGPRYVPADSGLEHRFAGLMADAGIAMRRQVDTGDDAHWTGRVDFRHVRLPLIAEIQSRRHHGALVDRERDRRRVTELEAAGFRVEEVWDDDVWSRPWAVVAQMRSAVQALTVL